MIRNRSLGFVTDKRPEIAAWDAKVEALSQANGKEGGQLLPLSLLSGGSTWEQITTWLENNKTVVYITAAGLLALAFLRRR